MSTTKTKPMLRKREKRGEVPRRTLDFCKKVRDNSALENKFYTLVAAELSIDPATVRDFYKNLATATVVASISGWCHKNKTRKY